MLPKHVLLAVLGAMAAEASVLRRDSPFAKTLSRRQDFGGDFGDFGGGGGGGGDNGMWETILHDEYA